MLIFEETRKCFPKPFFFFDVPLFLQRNELLIVSNRLISHSHQSLNMFQSFLLEVGRKLFFFIKAA